LNHPARDEIWAFGLRNPWRYSFDDPTKGGTGALIIADVGQSHYEEINYEPRGKGGRNYGWRNREGKHSNEDVEDRPVAFQPLTDPIYDYPRSVGRSITGGFVYRGRRLGEGYRGRYFFADYVMGRVWSLGLAIDGAGEATATDLREHTAELGGRSVFGAISSIGVDTDGELYLVNLGNAAAPASIIMIDGPPVSPPDPTGFKVIKK
jgi:glucose/arabinose dehydrogenase